MIAGRCGLLHVRSSAGFSSIELEYLGWECATLRRASDARHAPGSPRAWDFEEGRGTMMRLHEAKAFVKVTGWPSLKSELLQPKQKRKTTFIKNGSP